LDFTLVSVAAILGEGILGILADRIIMAVFVRKMIP
jgi:hypothetical protein